MRHTVKTFNVFETLCPRIKEMISWHTSITVFLWFNFFLCFRAKWLFLSWWLTFSPQIQLPPYDTDRNNNNICTDAALAYYNSIEDLPHFISTAKTNISEVPLCVLQMLFHLVYQKKQEKSSSWLKLTTSSLKHQHRDGAFWGWGAQKERDRSMRIDSDVGGGVWACMSRTGGHQW